MSIRGGRGRWKRRSVASDPRRRSPKSQIAIYLTPMCDKRDLHKLLRIVDVIDDAVIADADSI
jgi:hypothetical protein